METKIMSHIAKGLILSLILIVLSLAGHLLNIDLESWFGWISGIIFIVGIIWGVNYYGKQLNNNVTFGNLFAHGFKITAVVICITFLYTLLSIYVLFPDFIDRIIEKSIQQGKMSSDQYQQNAATIKKIISVTIFAAAIFINAIIGAIGALIGAAITKKNPQTPFGNQAV